MKVAIDGVGRLVIPKTLRDELGISGPTEIELISADGYIELSVPDVAARVEAGDGLPIIVPETPIPPMTVEDAREAIDRARR